MNLPNKKYTKLVGAIAFFPNTNNAEMEPHNCAVDHVAFSQDGVYLASAGADGVVKFWAVEE